MTSVSPPTETKVPTKENWFVRNNRALSAFVLVVILTVVIWLIVEYAVPDDATVAPPSAGPTEEGRWLLREVPVYEGESGVAGSFRYAAGSAVEELEMMYFDRDAVPIARGAVQTTEYDGMITGATYVAPEGTHFSTVWWKSMVEEPEDNAAVLWDVFEQQAANGLAASLAQLPAPPSVTSHLSDFQKTLEAPVLEVGSARLDGRALTGGFSHIATCPYGVMPWSGIYVMYASKVLPAGSRVRFHMYGRSGNEYVRVGALGGNRPSANGPLLGFATPEDPETVLEVTDHEHPRVQLKTLAAGGTYLEMGLAEDSSTLFFEFSNDSWANDVWLASVELDGAVVWSQDLRQADIVRLPMNYVLNRDDPLLQWRTNGYVPPIAIRPLEMRRFFGRIHVIVGMAE